MASNTSGLSINNDVVARMAEMAALETDGVVALSNRPMSLQTILLKKGGTKSVIVSTEHDIINIDIYVKVNDSAKVSDIAERVQLGVKDKLQGMTGSAVTKVNVVISDVEVSE